MNAVPHQYHNMQVIHDRRRSGGGLDLKYLDHVRTSMKREMALHIFDELVLKGHIKLTEELDMYARPGETVVAMKARFTTC